MKFFSDMMIKQMSVNNIYRYQYFTENNRIFAIINSNYINSIGFYDEKYIIIE